MRSGFWKTDWFFGLVVGLIMLLASNSDLLQGWERKAYDLGAASTSRSPSDRIAIVAIDDASISKLGNWPWPREIHARMAEIMVEANAKVVASTEGFTESSGDRGYQYIVKLLNIAGRSETVVGVADSGSSSKAQPLAPLSELGQFLAVLKEAEGALGADNKISSQFERAGNVLLPIRFTIGESRGKLDRPLPEYVARNAIAKGQQATPEGAVPLQTTRVQYPNETLGRSVAGLGHLNAVPDIDGTIRTEPLVLRHSGENYPALSLMVAARSLNLGSADIKFGPADGITLGKQRINTDSKLQMLTYFYADQGKTPPFQADSFYDVFSGKIDAGKKYRDKIVLIGPSTVDAGNAVATPASSTTFPVVMLAHAVSSILQGHFFVSPAWGRMAENAAFLLVALYLIVVLPQLNLVQGVVVTLGMLVLLGGVFLALMGAQSIWIRLVAPALLLIVGYLALIAKRFVLAGRSESKTNDVSAESVRMLALAYQGQGQLELAWEKFKLVPASDALMDNLYNLALEFERKQLSPKAEEVFRHISAHNPNYRDVASKLLPAAQPPSKNPAGKAAAGTGAGIRPDGAAGKMTLGRYHVEKELGKGAMGVVYLGKDPKIGRVVAIKTMALAQEFAADELEEIKERFFREAESAGRLAHQNIVTIYDAGEERDLAYIAMEMLKGGDLVPFTKPDALLPMEKAISIAARTADALGYAHKLGVVHRDIKPANIMYHLESDTVKVTDFGIARLTDSSKTKTGMVLGTPSYMSPEQLAGSKIDGRSDLFSLAVSLYQLLCGKLPFEGGSMGQLMYKISSEPPADILMLNPNVSHAIVSFLDRALEKDPDHRYQTGDEFAAALREAVSSGDTLQSTADAARGGVDIQL